jgi:hypothetical protein
VLASVARGIKADRALLKYYEPRES